jgi:transcription antitermination factor NusG
VTEFTLGDRVRITAPSYPGSTGTVTDPSNGNTELTVTVLVDAREYVTPHETFFDPTDELELVSDERSEDTAAAEARCAGPAVSA